MKILNVDDNPTNLYMLEALLKNYGHEVTSVVNGIDALSLLERHRFDLIITDILMPGMDGFQLCMEVRKREELRGIPIIVYTATYTDEKDREFALKIGASRFILKPEEPARFVAVIDELLKERIAPAAPELTDTAVYLQEYNNRLINKIERKMQQLGELRQKLQKVTDEKNNAAIDRIHAEAALQIAEDKYRSIFENAIEGIFQLAPDGVFISINPSFARMLGFSSVEEALRTADSRDAAGHAALRELREVIPLLSRGETASTRELKLSFDNGTSLWVLLNTRAIGDMSGNLVFYEGSMIDITGMKQAEEACADSERRYLTIFQEAAEGILIADMATKKFLYANPRICAMLGYGEDELKLLGVDDIHPRECLPDVIAAFEAPLRGELKLAHSLPCRRKDGSVFPADISTSMITIDGKRCNVGFFTDITEQVRAEDAMHRSEKRYREILEEIEDGYYEVDTRGTFTFFNNAMCAILGYEPDALHNVNYTSFARGDTAAKVFQTFNQVYTTGTPAKAFDWELTRKDGSKCIVETSVSPMRDDGGVITGFHGIARNVTDRYLLQQQLTQAQKLESIGRLAGGIAHDFNNMLMPIIGYAEMLKKSSIDEAGKNCVDQIIFSAIRSRDLVRQLLSFAKKQPVEIKLLDLNRIFASFEKILRRMLQENITIATRMDPSTGLIMADASQMEQVILNLCVNAQDAMPAGGTLTIETGNAEIGGERRQGGSELEPGRYVVMSITDTGTGMDQETLKSVFDPFFTTKAPGRGTGLGLATVYGIVKQHGGDISVSSAPGAGTTFTVYFPWHGRSSESNETALACDEAPGGTETILVVEDELMIQNIIARMLENKGYRIITAANGKSAREMMAAHGSDIDLLIIDIVLQDVNGMALYEELSRSKPDLKVLYMSGYTPDAVSSGLITSGKMNFLQKPFTLNDLALKVRDALGGHGKPGNAG